MNVPHVDLRIVGCEAEVWLNDFPIHRASAIDSPVFLSRPVAEFVQDGDNLLTVIPSPGTTPSTSRQSRAHPLPPGSAIEARLVSYEEGDFPGSGAGKEIIAVRYENPAGALPAVARPIAHRRTLQHGGTPWGWQRAKALSLDPGTSDLILRATQMAHAAFAERNADFFLRLGQIYFSEYARAYPGMSAERREQRFRAGFAGRPEQPEWRIAPLDPINFDFRLCADGRLVELICKDFKPVLRGTSKPYPFQMFLGLLDGRLQMLR
jgi:hypothetical protein